MGRRSKTNRLVRAREPNGRILRIPETAPGEVKRLRDAALIGLRDPEWGTPCGQLFLLGRLSAEQYAAAKWWSILAADYTAVISGPRAVRSGNLDPQGGEAPDPDSERGREIAERERAVVFAFQAALVCLEGLGKHSEYVVRAACEGNYYPTSEEDRRALNIGLSTLATYRGLTNQKKSDVR